MVADNLLFCSLILSIYAGPRTYLITTKDEGEDAPAQALKYGDYAIDTDDVPSKKDGGNDDDFFFSILEKYDGSLSLDGLTNAELKSLTTHYLDLYNNEPKSD